MATSQRKALIVEDDDDIRAVLREILEGAGYAVQEAADGITALDALLASPERRLVMLDNLLPGMDGIRLLTLLEGERAADGSAAGSQPALRHVYVFITASPQKITPEQAERLACLGAPVVAKPFDLATLNAAIERAAQRL